MSEKGSPSEKSSSNGDAEKVIPSPPSSQRQQPPMLADMAANPEEQPKPSGQAPSAALTLSSPVQEQIPLTDGDTGCSDRKFLELPKPSGQAPSATLTLSSPVREWIPPTGGDSGSGDRKFLEHCFLCHGRLSLNRDVFMYSDMRAFCSAQCRQEQMNNEGFMENEDHHAIPDKLLNLPGFVHPKRDSNDP